jgi:hypothetical protein
MEQQKRIILEHIEDMDEEQIDALYFLISYANNCKTYGDLMKFAGLYDQVDSARPQEWSDKCRNEMGFNPAYFVWSYQENSSWGKPVNLAAAVLEKLCKTLNYDYPFAKRKEKQL